LPGAEVEQKPTVIEQFAYSDTWADGTASYLAMITPRLTLMRELQTSRFYPQKQPFSCRNYTRITQTFCHWEPHES
jgi:hypothetical protein